MLLYLLLLEPGELELHLLKEVAVRSPFPLFSVANPNLLYPPKKLFETDRHSKGLS